jgi:uncharacterized protein DUF6602
VAANNKHFYDNFDDYLISIKNGLINLRDTSGIMNQSVDKGILREQAVGKFLKNHMPSFCNVFYGGYLFNLEGEVSSQIDIIMNSGTSPQFKLQEGGIDKSFGCIEGTIGVVEVKTNLDKQRLIETLNTFSTIPKQQPFGEIIKPPGLEVPSYGYWPYKILIAFDGINRNSITEYIHEFLDENPGLDNSRLPDIIYIVDQGYLKLFKTKDELRVYDASLLKAQGVSSFGNGLYVDFANLPEHTALYYILRDLQIYSQVLPLLSFNYDKIMDNLFLRISGRI